jgi:hypothetical protein
MPKKKNINDFLTEEFEKAAKGQVNDETLNEAFDELKDACAEGTYNINDVDYNMVFEQLMPDAMYNAFYEGRPGLSNARSEQLIEEADKACKTTKFDKVFDKLVTTHMRHHTPSYDISIANDLDRILAESDGIVPITASYVDSFRERCKTRIMSDFTCPPAATATQDCYSRLDMPCSRYVDRKICEMPLDMPPEFCCNDTNEDDPAQFYGLGKERCWEPGRPCYIHFAFALHRNIACLDADAEMRREIDRRRQWFDIIDERNFIRWAFDALSCETGCNQYPYTYDNVTYESMWLTAADNGPWVNVLQDPDLAWTDCTCPPYCAIEQVFEGACDPMTGMPVDCGGEYQVMMTRRCKAEQYQRAIGSHLLTTCGTYNGCNAERRVNMSSRDGWSPVVKWSRWMWNILVDFYLNCYDGDGNGTVADRIADPDLALRTAELWAENTYLVSKSFTSTFGQVVDFDVSTREFGGTNTWAYFDRGITFARRYERMAAFTPLRPWLTVLVRAFDNTLDADGTAIPTE